MNDVFQNIKKTAADIIRIPRRLAEYSDDVDRFTSKKRVKINNVALATDWADMSSVASDTSDVTDEKVSWMGKGKDSEVIAIMNKEANDVNGIIRDSTNLQLIQLMKHVDDPCGTDSIADCKIVCYNLNGD